MKRTTSRHLSLVLVLLGSAGILIAYWYSASVPVAGPRAAGTPLPAPVWLDGLDQHGIDLHGDPVPDGAVARLGTVRFRHPEWFVFNVAHSPDGRTIASADTYSLCLWDAGTGGRRWQVRTGPPAGMAVPTNRISGVAFAPDGERLAIAGDRVILREAATGKEIREFKGHQGFLQLLAFTPDGKYIVAGGPNDPVIYLWEIASGNLLRQFEGLDEDETGLAFRFMQLSADGQTLIGLAVNDDNQQDMFFWNVATGTLSERLTAKAPDQICRHMLRLWSMATGRPRDELAALQETAGFIEVRFGARSPWLGYRFRKDGKQVVIHHDEKPVQLWDVPEAKRAHVLAPLAEITSLEFSPDGRTLAAGGAGAIRQWDLATGQEVRRASRHQGIIGALAFSPHGTLLASGGYDATIRLWDVATGKQLHLLAGPVRVQALAFTPDGKTLAAAGYKSSRIRFWDVATGEELPALPGHDCNIMSIAYTPDGKQLAAGGSDSAGDPVKVWDIATRQLVRRFGDKLAYADSVNRIAFSPDGRLLAAGSISSPSLRIWRLHSGEKVVSMDSQGTGYPVGFTTDGKALAWWSADGSAGDIHLRLLDVAGLKDWSAFRLPGVSAVALSADGGRLLMARADQDTTPSTLDLATRKVVAQFKHGHEGKITAIAASPDGRLVATGGSDTTILLWDTGCKP